MLRIAPHLILASALALVFWLCLAPTPLPSNDLQQILQPFDHVILYAALSFVVYLCRPGRTIYITPLLVTLAIGLESVQILLPARAYENLDLIANLGGIAIGSGIVWIIRKMRFIQESTS